MKKAVSVRNLSKVYRLWSAEEHVDSLAAETWRFLRNPLRNYRKYRSLYDFSDVFRGKPAAGSEVIWALNNVSFDVDEGEVLAIIGANGAGKTTLLKILSRITPPTAGKARVRGRISSLLEVGTGFHPDLTGRENVYLNGTVLGMRRKEVDRKFDEIVAFSEVEQFIETPVKRYSVGMRVRLAFAVAAHLEPEILIVDEVLAVGDAEFQKKCLNRMESVGQEGRTVLFVSHNMAAINRLCDRAILLDEGGVAADGPANDVVTQYLTQTVSSSAKRVWDRLELAPGDKIVRLRSVSVVSEDDESTVCRIDRPIGLRMRFRVLEGGWVLVPQFVLHDENGIRLFTSLDTSAVEVERPLGEYVVTAWIPANLLSEQVYYVSVGLRTKDRRYKPVTENDVVAFSVIDPMEGGSVRGSWMGRLRGVIRPALRWETEGWPPRTTAGKADEVVHLEQPKRAGPTA